MALFLFKMTTLDHKMASLSPWVSSICLKLQCCVLDVIGMHTQFPAADENLMNSEKRFFVSFFFFILEAQRCVTFTVGDVKGERGPGA